MNSPLSILLVDDDRDDQEIFLDVIQSLLPSSSCVTARNGREALDKLLNKEVHPDVIFLDLNMPLMNGKQFLMEINKHSEINKIPITILSTSSDLMNIAETKKLGASHFITKPDRFAEWERELKKFFLGLFVSDSKKS